MQDVEHATFANTFTIQEGELSDEEIAQLDKYLEHYANTEGKCVKCEKKLLGTMVDQLIGGSTFEWGLVHGQGNCKNCGWPVVLYHFPKDTVLERFEAPLCVHPDYVEKRGKANAGR